MFYVLMNCVWSVFCSVRVYISLHFQPILLVKLDFGLLSFCMFCFLILSFALCFEFNAFLKDLITLYNNQGI